ncbi:hypothetical protein ASPACDRAFT_45714 [Aspergillus aculeatus ATCC 16872]|uniref:CFEM domain-containing protein n=1 Tax=Aspergillus aculeatus (strain ATCC 16872 / CBS 172.66 / WB 5094) TaxID=690307 RepID=A0A1L9WN80_ASPA1|nr:uncharacterized protein ASPACDRAFT_45714 [Aspergillus aculeatus ATCC 16872]OJJ97623.1 hypothetical protein ASPACDRAFT_45714 [Aspergillus aculeatus ATCC 16872]
MNSTLLPEFLSDLPACAAQCFETAMNASSCATTDRWCICTGQSILETALGCYSLSCTPKQSLFSTNYTRAACGIHEESKASLTPALAGSLGMLALIMTGLRMAQRTMMKRSFGWDDGLIVMAMACAAILNIMAFPSKCTSLLKQAITKKPVQKHGLGTNIWTIPFEDITTQLKLLLIAEIFYMPAEALTQLSFLAFYLRIFPPGNFRYIVYTLAGISVCFGISNTLIMIFQCLPVSYFWNSWSGEATGHCIDINTYSWYRAAMQIAMDLSIIALPIYPLSKLALSRRKKTLVLLMFCTGFLITVVSCLRLQSLIRFSKSANISMDNNPAIYWSMVECDVAIVCACMPCLPALLKPLLPACFGSRYYASSDNERTPPVKLERIRRKDEFSVLSTAVSEDALMASRG